MNGSNRALDPQAAVAAPADEDDREIDAFLAAHFPTSMNLPAKLLYTRGASAGISPSSAMAARSSWRQRK